MNESSSRPAVRDAPRRTKKRAGRRLVPGRLLKFWPEALLLMLVVVLAVPVAMMVAPAFVRPEAPAATAEPPAWQRPPATNAARPLLPSLQDTAPLPSPSAVSGQLEPLLKADGGGSFTALVQDALTGQVLFDHGGSDNRIPASNMKLLTAVAALRALGPDHTFSTRVLAGPVAGQVVLAGGGDVLLGAGDSLPAQVMGHAGLATLAASTVAALQKKGNAGEVTVLLDDSLFSGPALNPAWAQGDVEAGELAPLFPLAMNSARFDPTATSGPRPQDSALTAAQAFAAQLKVAGSAAGLTVADGIERLKAPPGSPGVGARPAAGPVVLAEVQSAPVSQQVDLMLQTSDNYLAEVLGRMSAVAAGLPGSNAAATEAVRNQLTELGIPTDAMRLADVCGLALDDQVSARQFAEVVRAITSGTDTRLRAALAGFPVAGISGTLGTRYGDDSTSRGAGLVRAKTGTLNSVIALSGYVVDADGRLLVFSFIGNGLTAGASGNKEALDRAATALAGCGCR